MTPARLAQVGQLLYGPAWRFALADALRVNRRTIARWANGEYNIPEGIDDEIRQLLLSRRGQIDAELI